jgi:tetratricopeptide (TPR) repeat protein
LLTISAGIAPSAFAQNETEAPQLEAVPQTSADPVEQAKMQADQAYRQGQHARAIELAETVLAKNAQDHVALYLRASSRVELGLKQRDARMIRQGVADAREAIRIEKNGKADYYLPYLFGMTNLAIVERKPAHAEMARSVADQVLEKEGYSDEERANIIYQRGLANIQAKATDSATQDFNETIRLKPDHLAAFIALCNLTNELRGADEALAVYNRAIASVPENPLLFNNRAMHFQSMGRYRDAIADFTSALKIEPQYVPALINRAYVEMLDGQPVAAEQDLGQAIQIDPSSLQAYSLRGTLRTQQGRTAEAIADYLHVCEQDPKNGQAAADLGFAYFFAKDYSKALTQFDKALELNREIMFLTPWRYAAALRTGKDLSRDPAIQAAIAKEPNKRNWFEWLTLYEMNRVSDAELLKAADPTNEAVRKAQLCEAYYFIGLELVRRKKTDDAKAFFTQAVGTDAQRLSAFRGARVALRDLDGRAAK